MTTTSLIALAASVVTGPGWACTAHHAARLRRRLTDRLTGLANRDALERAFRRARGRGLAVGVLLLDLDGFKAINDTHGHAAGNALLRHVARQLWLACPGVLPVRLHGDEFAVLLGHLPPGVAGQRAAEQRAARIAAAIAAPMVWGGEPIAVTASIGIAVAPAADDLSALLRVADQRMYARKPTNSASMGEGRWS